MGLADPIDVVDDGNIDAEGKVDGLAPTRRGLLEFVLNVSPVL